MIASTFSSSPMIAMVRDAGATSMMLARKMELIWMISLRCSGVSACTLMSTSSRRIDCSARSTLTECTGNILRTWLQMRLTCWSFSARISIVMRETSGFSMAPTARDSML